MASEAGKGSQQRPKQVSEEDYAQRWDLIFGRDKQEEDQETETQEEQPL